MPLWQMWQAHTVWPYYQERTCLKSPVKNVCEVSLPIDSAGRFSFSEPSTTMDSDFFKSLLRLTALESFVRCLHVGIFSFLRTSIKHAVMWCFLAHPCSLAAAGCERLKGSQLHLLLPQPRCSPSPVEAAGKWVGRSSHTLGLSLGVFRTPAVMFRIESCTI